MREQLKEVLKSNGQSLKWFWENNLKESVSYAYFNMQLNDNSTLKPNVEKAISDFLLNRDREVSNNAQKN